MAGDRDKQGMGSPVDGESPELDTENLVALLDRDDPNVRASAAWSLAERAANDAIPVAEYANSIASHASDDEDWVRRGATWALAEIAAVEPRHVQSEIDTLVDALDDDDPLVRENAVVGVSRLTEEYPETAARALEKLLVIVNETDDRRIREYANEALDRITDRLGGATVSGEKFRIGIAPKYAEAAPSSNVMEVDDGLDDGVAVRTEEGDEDDEADEEANEEEDDDTGRSRGSAKSSDRRLPHRSGPPLSVPEPADVSLLKTQIELLERSRSGLLTDETRARADPSSVRGTVPVTIHTITENALTPENAEEVIAATESAMTSWRRIDDHETVLTTLGYGDDYGGEPWLATEVADGLDFRKYAIAADFSEALFYASCLVRAVSHAHGHDVVHGGLSPDSIGFVEPIAETWHVPKIADWGFGPVIREHLDRLPVPLPYAAPEQIDADSFGRVDQATDVYGLGSLLYSLFAGRPPFGAEADDVAKRIRSDGVSGSLSRDLPAPDPPSAYDETVPAEIDELVTEALSWDRMARYETVVDLRRDFETVYEEYAHWE